MGIFCKQDLIDTDVRPGYDISGTLLEVGHGWAISFLGYIPLIIVML